MKTLVTILLLGLFFGCKNKDNPETTAQPAATESTEMVPDTTVAAQPIDDPEPGVEQSGSQEQVP